MLLHISKANIPVHIQALCLELMQNNTMQLHFVSLSAKLNCIIISLSQAKNVCPDCYLSSSDVWYLVKLLFLDHKSEPEVLLKLSWCPWESWFCHPSMYSYLQGLVATRSTDLHGMWQTGCFLLIRKPVYTSQKNSTFCFKPLQVILQELKIKIKKIEKGF